MLNIVVAILTIAYILVAYVGPVVAIGLSVYWAWGSMQGGGSFGGAAGVFIISALVLLVGLMIAKRLLKWVMNQVDLGEDAEDAAPEDKTG